MQIIDLSHPYYEGMPQHREQWFSSPRVTRQINPESGRATLRLELITSSGTHIKAPKFLNSDLRSIEHLAMKELFHYATIIHLSEKREKGLITFEDLQAFYIKPGDGVVLHTGWSSFWGVGEYYIDFPLITSDAAEYLVLEKNICFLGADAPFSTEVQQVMLEKDRFLIENLTNLDRINLNRFFLIALPLNIYSGDAAPARVVAVENDNFIV